MNKDIMPFSRGAKMGDTGMDLVLVAAIGVGGYLLYKAFGGIFSSTASQANAANNAAVTTSTAAANQATAAQVAASGQQPTLSPNSINGLVTTIVTSMNQSGDYPFSADSSNYTYATQIENAVLQVNNTADWVSLYNAFGSKQLITGQTVDLLGALSIVLDASMKSSIDSYFVSQQIGSPNYIMIP